MDGQLSDMLLGIIEGPSWLVCCCHVHVAEVGGLLLILMTVMVKHHCGGLLMVVIWIVLMFSLSMEPILTTRGGACNIVWAIYITNAMSYCHSKFHGSPIDIARLKGRATILSMMTEVLKCE